MRARTIPFLFVLVTLLALHCGGTTSPGVGDASAGGAGGGGGGGAAGGGGGGGGACAPACAVGRTCCGTECVNTYDDPSNCGSCGVVCSGATSYCEANSCQAPPCAGGTTCGAGTLCCGSECCTSGQLCCANEGPVAREPTCFTPTAQQPTCPPGCAPECVSDRNVKRDFEPVDGRGVLESLARVPMSTWSYRSEDRSVRHLGPMAQDFHEAFGLGS